MHVSEEDDNETKEHDEEQKQQMRKEKKERAVKEREDKVKAELDRLELDIGRSRRGIHQEEGERDFKCAIYICFVQIRFFGAHRAPVASQESPY
jgi:hypothetical protein